MPRTAHIALQQWVRSYFVSRALLDSSRSLGCRRMMRKRRAQTAVVIDRLSTCSCAPMKMVKDVVRPCGHHRNYPSSSRSVWQGSLFIS